MGGMEGGKEGGKEGGEGKGLWKRRERVYVSSHALVDPPCPVCAIRALASPLFVFCLVFCPPCLPNARPVPCLSLSLL